MGTSVSTVSCFPLRRTTGETQERGIFRPVTLHMEPHGQAIAHFPWALRHGHARGLLLPAGRRVGIFVRVELQPTPQSVVGPPVDVAGRPLVLLHRLRHGNRGYLELEPLSPCAGV